MKLRDDIGLIDQGMASEFAASTDKWVVAYHQVTTDAIVIGKYRVVAPCMGVLVGISTAVHTPSPVPLGGSMACGASMPCGAGTSNCFLRRVYEPTTHAGTHWQFEIMILKVFKKNISKSQVKP